jgi:hypothetical protein
VQSKISFLHSYQVLFHAVFWGFWNPWILAYVINVLFRLIAVGDPKQLPPTLSYVGAEWEDEQSSATEKNSVDDNNTQSLNYGHDGESRKMPSDLRRCEAMFLCDKLSIMGLM